MNLKSSFEGKWISKLVRENFGRVSGQKGLPKIEIFEQKAHFRAKKA